MDANTLRTTIPTIDDEPPRQSFDLIEGLGAKEIDRELRLADRQSDVGTRRLAFYLADMEQRGICQLLGYATATVYAVKRLELGRRHAQQLIAAGRALDELPKIDAAFCEGRINWTRVRLLTKIAVPETEAAWLDRALVLRLGEFEREVLTSEKGRPPRIARKGLPQVKIGVSAKLDRLQYEAWELAKRKLGDERGEAVTDGELMAFASRMLLATRADGTVPGRARVDDSIYRIIVDRCSDCHAAYLQTAEGPAELRTATLEELECDAKVEVVRDVEAGSENAAPEAGGEESGLEIADPTPPWMRTKVLIRDGYSCRVCGARVDVHAHHVEWRSNQGRTRPSNLATVCSRCHGLVHEDLLRMSGTAPHALVVSGKDGEPLARSPQAIGAQLKRLRVLTPIEEGVAEDGAVAAGDPAPAAAVSFAAVPRFVDARWFGRHAHLFRWSDVRGEMAFEPGCAIEPEPALAEEARPVEPGSRPRSLGEMVGQPRLVETLGVAVAAAKVRGRPLHHVLLLGEPGLGKTTLARAVAEQMGARVSVTSGPLIKDAAVLIKALSALAPNEVLFIDEIHALPRQVAESLYEALEDGVLRLPVTDGHRTRTMEVRLNPFTLIGATTELGRVPAPLQSRFTIREHVDAYAEPELAEIVRRVVVQERLEIEPAAAAAIARLARGVPREAVKLVQRVLDFAVASGVTTVERSFVDAAMRKFGIDERGLGTVERKALGALERHGKGRPMGLSRWSASSGLCVTVLRQVCEPVLLRHGLIAVTHRGRMAV